MSENTPPPDNAAEPTPPPPPPPAGGAVPPPPAYGNAPVPGLAPNGRMYADWVWRVIAFLIDYAPIFVLNIIAYIFYMAAFASSFSTQYVIGPDGYPEYQTIGGGFSFFPFLIALILWLVGLAFYFWNKGYREGTTGKSIGKQITGYTTVKEETGEPLGVGAGCLRALLLYVDFWICYIGVLWPLWDAKRQCLLSDKATGAVVYKD